jgi:serine/threonine-protein kinase
MGEDKGVLGPGALLDNRYEVVRQLAEGGMATVYLVRHLGLESQHALKVPDATLLQSPEARHRFTTEARLQAQLRHPHIAQVTDIVISPVPGLVMEYVEGGTLEERCAQGPNGKLSLPLLREVFLPVLDAMEAAHVQRVVHRDLTPSNILLGKGERGRLHPKVTDFGIAKVGQDEPGQKYRTRTGALLGTRPYMSPEQIRGSAEVDARTDIFALGAILYEAATGLVAFDADSDFELMKRITEGRYLPPEKVAPELPPALCQCIHKALAVNLAERFQTCSAFRAALEQALETRPTPLEVRAPVAPRTVPAPRRRGSVLAVVSAVLLAGLSGLLLVRWVSALLELDAVKEENGRLQASQRLSQKDLQQLTQERDAALGRATQAEQASQKLQAQSQEALQQVQQHEQLHAELQSFQDHALKFMEGVLLDTATRNSLQVYRVFRLCNRTDVALTYRFRNEAQVWSELRELAPHGCDSGVVQGYQPRVPVTLIPASGGTPLQAEAMSGVVVGWVPDRETEWKPWENELVAGPDNALQLKPLFIEPPPLGSALQQP